MRLANDIARCNGARHNNDRDAPLMSECNSCARRKQILRDGPDGLYVFMAPPLFVQGKCPSKIEDAE